MRGMVSLVMATVALHLAFAQSAENPKTGKSVYFLKDDLGQQWCGYASETQYKAQVRDRAAFVVGEADYADGRLAAVHFTETDETGDWAVIDEYTLDKEGNLESLKRTINLFSEDSSEEQRFTIRNGKAVQQGSMRRKLHLARASQKSVTEFDAPKVVTTATNFPFAELLGIKRDEVWSKGSVCVP